MRRAVRVAALTLLTAAASSCGERSTGGASSSTASSMSAAASSSSASSSSAAASSSAPRSASARGPTASSAPVAGGLDCKDSVEDIYRAPTDLARFSPGDIVRCAREPDLDAASLARRLSADTAARISSGDLTIYLVAYRTTRGNGAAALGTAKVFVPATPRARPAPLLVAAHGTVGVADDCAPSKSDAPWADYLSLPFAAHGYAVIAPDYAGLGTDGVQGYGDGRDTALSSLHAARALSLLVGGGANRAVVVGHSQGGGTALSMQAVEHEEAATLGVKIEGVVAVAPGWQTTASVEGFSFADAPTDVGFGLPAVVATLYTYAYFSNYVGLAHGLDPFAASVREDLGRALEGECIVRLLRTVPRIAPTFGELFDRSFREHVLGCGRGTEPCVEPAASYVAFVKKNVLTGDAKGARVLVVEGMADTAVVPARVACVRDKLVADGVKVDLCTDDDATHIDVVGRAEKPILAWLDAVYDGGSPPACTARELPACKTLSPGNPRQGWVR
ncbi:MAG: alpha/beta fold hydrolase [Polyangiaceae bacterium]